MIEKVEAALAAVGGPERRVVTSSELQQWIGEHDHDAYEEIASSWASYLSRAAGDPGTRIQQAPAGYGYVLGDPPPDENARRASERPTEDEAAVENDDQAPPRRAYHQREALLYQPLADWLVAQDYQADVRARTRSGGAWGNPDVTGIRIEEGFFDHKDIELATIEAKLTSYQWRYWFFEAVSHKRFSHRAYFAFGHGSDTPSLTEIEDAAEMREYGEKYRVGVLVMFMPTLLHQQVVHGDIGSLTLDLSAMRIEELWPAPYEAVRPDALRNHLRDVLAFSADGDLYQFGRQTP